MVVASTLSFLAVNGKLGGITKGDLTSMAVANETRVGKWVRSNRTIGRKPDHFSKV